MKYQTKYFTVMLFALFMQACGESSQVDDLKEKDEGDDLVYVPMSENVFESSANLQKWADEYDTTKIFEHAWNIWGGMTAMTDQMYPSNSVADAEGIKQVKLAVFSTWYDEFETFSPPTTNPRGKTMHLHGARQVSANPGQAQPAHGGGEVLSFNKYTKEFVDYVADNKLYYLKTIGDMNAKQAKDGVPQYQREIPSTFNPHATMLKPTFWIIKKDAAVAMPYWKGPHDDVNGTAYPDRPMSTTWEQFVIVNPTGEKIPAGTTFKREILTQNGKIDTLINSSEAEIVGLDRFYYLPLTSEDINYIKAGNIFTIGGLDIKDIKPGDLALLVGCHVTTAEFGPWTWQTFFWSPHPSRTPQASANVKPPFTNYDMTQAYYMLNQNGSHHVAFNPYLEPPIISPIIVGNPIDKGLGRNSNCMSCHHSAAFPTMNMDPSFANMLTGSYLGSGEIKPDNTIFYGRIKTNFMWGLLMQLQGRTSPDGKIDSMSVYQFGFQD